MNTCTLIRSHIAALPMDQPFTTNCFLTYGKRSSVDTALHRLIKTGYVTRLARGVFIKTGSSVPAVDRIELTVTKTYKKTISLPKAQIVEFPTVPARLELVRNEATSDDFSTGQLLEFPKKRPEDISASILPDKATDSGKWRISSKAMQVHIVPQLGSTANTHVAGEMDRLCRAGVEL